MKDQSHFEADILTLMSLFIFAYLLEDFLVSLVIYFELKITKLTESFSEHSSLVSFAYIICNMHAYIIYAGKTSPDCLDTLHQQLILTCVSLEWCELVMEVKGSSEIERDSYFSAMALGGRGREWGGISMAPLKWCLLSGSQDMSSGRGRLGSLAIQMIQLPF